tara:strand:+ start:3096 stop:3443 length:348 start_codon:yes stop_codon:yes gene_type:complete
MTLANLTQIQGLANFHFLEDKDRSKIKELEEEKNTGVFDVLKKSHVLLLTHDSRFRSPPSPIVVDGEFPAVKFPELEGAISASPGIKVHKYLVEKFNLVLTDEATLLVGWNSVSI